MLLANETKQFPKQRPGRLLALAFLAEVLLGCASTRVIGKTMNTQMVDRFSAAYDGADVDPSAVRNVYTQWIASKLQTTSGLPESMRTDVVSRIIQDRCHEIASVPHQDKVAELDADRIWTELWPLDERSEARATEIHNGQSLAGAERDAALADKAQVEAIEARVKALPAGLQSQFGDTVSEATLDIGYALTGGSGPSSLRLNRSRQ